MLVEKKISGWSSYKYYNTKVFTPNSVSNLIHFLKNNDDNTKIISRGHGCSFGDQAICSNKNAVTIDMSSLNKIVKLDKENKILKVESGAKLNQILKFLLTKNLTLNSIPGGLEITVGGAISKQCTRKRLLEKWLF